MQQEVSGAGKIGPLWARYLSGGADSIPEAIDAAVTYSVYTEYESDHNGEYSVVLGRRVSATEIAGNFQRVEIPAGPYLVFRAASRSPEDMSRAWLGVYDYFASHRDCARAYQADFDKHSGAGVELYIGVKKAPKQ